jgi:hypothetical protein
MKRSESKSHIFPVPLLVMTGKELRMSRNIADITRRDLSCLPLAYTIGSPTFNSVIRVPNRQTGLVLPASV